MATDRVLVPGFGFAGYRSFSGEPVHLGPLGVFNVLAAQNNSGKSNVLRFAQEMLPQVNPINAEQRGSPKIAGLDVPAGGLDQTIRFSLAMTYEQSETVNFSRGARFRELPCLSPNDDELIWIDYEVLPGEGWLTPSSQLVARAIEEYGGEWNHHFRDVLSEMGGGTLDPTDVMRRVLSRYGSVFQIPPVATVAASRKIEVNGTSDSSSVITGQGVIQELAALQNPAAHVWADSKGKFEAINRFVQTVMDDQSVRLHVPHTRDTILIESSFGTLPLDNVGTGIHEVVMFAAASVMREKHLMCIEEPETHLHPILQRKLASFLTEETTNQYLVATHSAHLLNFDSSSIFHLTLEEGSTSLAGVRKPHEFSQVCADLGYRPSDLLQTNAVIWVEGPADRTYLKRWIELVNPALVEGVDYSLMIYGGSTLNHLSVSEEALQEFINLRRLNRHSTVVIDSDRTAARMALNGTKRRIRTEFESNESQGHAWVTAGYTIENYLPWELLVEAVATVHPGRKPTGNGGQWANPLPKVGGKSFDKVAIAREAVAVMDVSHLDVLDLKASMRKLVQFVADANGA